MPSYIPFSNCCGAAIVRDFGSTQTSIMSKHRIREKDIIADVRIAKRNRKCDAFLIAIINNTQKKNSIGELLEKEGFELLKSSKSTNHPSTSPLHLYVFSTRPVEYANGS